ncbi:MAG: Rrf2 family transcriptional regulator [Clostridiales bacterium]|nr:Rrf2 family transcriptional regulator [Clostridiales bacterium]
MMITTKGRYGTRFLLDLALNSSDRAVSLRDVAKRQGISDKYLEQIVPLLSRAGFIRSVRGAQGGYMLIHKPEDINLGDVLKALEGTLAPLDCVDPESECKCDRVEECVTTEVWKKIYDAVSAVVDSITFADLVNEYKKKTGQFDYYL